MKIPFQKPLLRKSALSAGNRHPDFFFLQKTTDKMRMFSFVFLFAIFIAGCVAHAPKYTRSEKVMQLKSGMTLGEVNKTLGLNPYYIHSMDSAGNKIYVYKYRLTDRKTVPLFMKDTNGIAKRGDFMDLYASFSPGDTLNALQSEFTETVIQEKRLDINSLLTLITVTAPALLVYFGLQ
ncbi:MAG: hypothetical protein ACOZCO_04805 [Bacteroidota bacterium]